MTTEIETKEPGWLPKISYALYDVGNSSMGAIHATFIFAVYFTTSIAPENGTTYWGYMSGGAAFIVAVLGPFLGGAADAQARRKFFLALFTLMSVVSTSLLWFAEPDNSFIQFAVIFSFISIVANELIFVFYNSLLQSVSTEKTMGKVSGWSWGLGFFGGMAALLIALLFFIQPDTPPFGLEKDSAEHVRATMVLASLWFFIFSLPIFFFTKESPESTKISKPLEMLKTGWTEVGKIKGLKRFLIARMFYVDGLTVVFAFAGIFAAKVFGFSNEMVLMFAIAVNFTCGVGALFGGWFDDKFGSFLVVRVSLICLMIFGLGVLLSPNATYFWILGLMSGLFIGPIQSASRSLVAHVAPPEHRAQIFGFYMLAGKITSFLGPIFYGSIVLWSGNERAGMVTAVLFFLIGFLILGKNEPGNKRLY